jgi:hypothetical protein
MLICEHESDKRSTNSRINRDFCVFLYSKAFIRIYYRYIFLLGYCDVLRIVLQTCFGELKFSYLKGYFSYWLKSLVVFRISTLTKNIAIMYSNKGLRI